MEPINFLLRARNLYENLEFLVSKPFKGNIQLINLKKIQIFLILFILYYYIQIYIFELLNCNYKFFIK